MIELDKLLAQAEAQQNEDDWEIISKYRRNDTYVDDDGAVSISGRRIDTIRENISVQGENNSQYIEFIMDRYYDGIDIAEQTLAIHYEVGDASDEDAPINVYKNDTQIKFGWVVESNLTQYETTIEFCIWARGTLEDGNTYVLKTLPQKYEIKRGLEIASGIIEPSNNWYTQFALNMDQKVAQASENADRAEQAVSSVDGVVETVTIIKDEVVQKASTVDSQHSEVRTWHQEAEQFRDEAEEFRNQAEAITGIGLAEEGKPGIVQPDGVTTKVDENGKLIVTSSGTTDYQSLENKPSIAGIELNGNKSYDELGIASKDTVARNFETVNQSINTLDTFTKSLDEDISTLDEELEVVQQDLQSTNNTVSGLETGLSQTNQILQSTTNKVDIIIEKADLGIKETVSGEQIHITDSSNTKVREFGLYGKAKQVTTTGKNLIPYPYEQTTKTVNGITFTDNGDGTVTVNGMSTHEDGSIYNVISPWSPALIIELQPNTSYILSGCPSGGDSLKYYLQYRLGNSDLSSSIWGSDFGEGVKIDTNDTNCYIGVRIVIRKGIPTENLVFKPMLRLASITDDTWEPYTGGIPSPNSSYPQDIEVVGESYNLLPYPYSETTHTQSGITWTDNGDGTVTANGTQSGGFSDFFLIGTDKPMILKAGTYIFNGCLSGGVLDKTYFMLIGSIIDGVTTRLANDVGNGATFTINKDTPIWALIRYSETAVATNHVFKPMLRKASVKNDRYMPYGKGSVEVKSENEDGTKSIISTIPTGGLAGIPVDSGGDYTDQNGQQWICDEIVKYADGSGEYIKRVESVVFDGVNNVCTWVSDSVNNGTLRQINLGNKASMPNSIFIKSKYILCDKFKPFEFTDVNDNFAYGCRQGSNLSICCLLKESDGVTDIASANEWLKNNNVKVYYIINPIRTPLTAEQLAEIEKLHTFYSVTNISNDFDCGMKVTYVVDAKTYVDNKIAQIAAAVVNSI